MIRNIFVPEVYNGYYIFTTRIIGIHITDHALYATCVTASGTERTIIQHFYEPLEHEGTTFSEKAEAALHNLSSRLPAYDKLHIALPSKEVICKELTLPFTDRHKIEMVAPFELEETLPFDVQDGIIATVPTHYENEQATVFAVALRRETFEKYITPCENVGLKPDVVTLDAVAFYTTYTPVKELGLQSGVTACIDIDINDTRIIVIEDGKLRLIRTLHKGLHSVCPATETTYNGIKDIISRCDAQEYAFAQTQLSSEIQFTIAAANKMLGPQQDITQSMIMGGGSEISNIKEELATVLPQTPDIFKTNALLRVTSISTNANAHVPPLFTTSTATALPAPETQAFNLKRTMLTQQEQTTRVKQLGVATALLGIFFISFMIYSFYRTSSLTTLRNQRETELRKELINTFGLEKQRKEPLSRLINQIVPNRVDEEETLWFSLSPQQTFSFLYYLQEMFTQIDYKGLGLDLKKLSIERDSKQGTERVKLEGSVKGYPELRSLEESLRDTKLFTEVPEQQDTKFSMSLTIAKSPERSS